MPTPSQFFAFVYRTRKKWLLGLGVVLLFMLGIRMPALVYLFPDVDILLQQPFFTMSLFSHGFMSWITAWSIFQLYYALKHRLVGESNAAVPLTDPFDLRLLVLALLLSAFSWYGVVVGVIGSFSDRPIDTRLVFTSLLIGTAGTSLYFFLGMLLDRIKRGFGFWLLLLLQALYFAGTSSLQSIAFMLEGTLSRNQLLLNALLIVASIFAAVVVLRPRAQNTHISPRHIFALCLLATSVATLAAPSIYAAFIFFVWPIDTAMGPAFMQEKAISLFALVIEILALLGVAWLFLGSLKNCLANWDIVLGLVAILVAAEIQILMGTGFWPSFWPLHFVLLAWAASELRHALPVSKPKPPVEDALDEGFRRGWR
jgi:hypothetical protein